MLPLLLLLAPPLARFPLPLLLPALQQLELSLLRDDLLLQAELDVSGLASALLELELAGRIVQDRDGRIHAIWA